MLDPQTINPFALPSVSLSERSQLPKTPCIYFAIDSQGVIQYIGKAKNLKKRWESHHKGIDLALLGGVKISYLFIEENLLQEVETALIHWFNPPLNRINLVETNAPKMIKIDFSVPEALWKEAMAVAEAEGWKPSDLHRIFWEKGFAVHAEGSNKRMINRRLRNKPQEFEQGRDE